MGRLSDFYDYLQGRLAVVRQVEGRLCDLQSKYETFFQEVTQVRERELSQLTAHILAARDGSGPALPPAFSEDLKVAEAEVIREFAEKLARLRQELAELEVSAEKTRQKSRNAEAEVRLRNEELDTEEEELKARNAELLARIADYNDRIRQMGRGFGFFANLFSMHRLRAQRRELDRQQADLAARIESLRARWQSTEKKHAQREKDLRKTWIDRQAAVASMAAKVQHLQENGASIRLRSTVEWVLFDQRATIGAPGADDPPCPRCGSGNPPHNHFCHICARRLTDDRPDFDGSILEIAELNHHHGRFSDGMKACQELIGLVRGLASGIEAFSLSVTDVMDSESKYPLPKLEITVPRFAVEYGARFDDLLQEVQADLAQHPQAFAAQVEHLIDEVFTEDKIKNYFELMGGELSLQADNQW